MDGQDRDTHSNPNPGQPSRTSEPARELPLAYEPGIHPGTAAARDARLSSGMVDIVSRDDGWLRLIPSRDGSLSYAKWKFTHGRHAGKYVMVAVAHWNALDLVPLLRDKLREVDAGMLRPTLDKYFSLD